jgi:transposase
MRNHRAYDAAPVNYGKTTTIVSSIRLDGSAAALPESGAMNAERFRDYINNYLIPALHQGDIVVMDNLSTHKAAGIKEAVEKAGCKVLYIPPYSPDLNPIEEMRSKLKAHLRKVKAGTNEHLLAAIAEGFSTITAGNCAGWFSHAGYS